MAKISTRKRKLREMEKQDALGISRKKWKFTIKPELYFILKLVCILLIPIVYFAYSPLLILCMIFYIGLFFLARGAEHSLNKSVIKSNHIHIPKFDCALALVVVVVAFAGVCFSGVSNQKGGMFDNISSAEISEFTSNKDFSGARRSNWWQSVEKTLTNLGSLLTGERSIFGSSKGEFNFGSMEPPEDFASDSDDIPVGNGGGAMSMDDLPVEYMFSSILSSINSVLIFSVSIFGALILLFVIYKKKKFETMMNEVIIEGDVTLLTDEEINKILSFGEEIEENSQTDKQINEKIKKDAVIDNQNELDKIQENKLQASKQAKDLKNNVNSNKNQTNDNNTSENDLTIFDENCDISFGQEVGEKNNIDNNSSKTTKMINDKNQNNKKLQNNNNAKNNKNIKKNNNKNVRIDTNVAKKNTNKK